MREFTPKEVTDLLSGKKINIGSHYWFLPHDCDIMHEGKPCNLITLSLSKTDEKMVGNLTRYDCEEREDGVFLIIGRSEYIVRSIDSDEINLFDPIRKNKFFFNLSQ